MAVLARAATAAADVIVLVVVVVHCVSKKTGPLLPFAITPTVLVQ